MSAGVRLAVSCAILVGALLATHLRSPGEAIPLRKSLSSFPDTVDRWQAHQDSFLQAEIISFLKVDDYLMRRYVDPDGHSLWLYVAYWAGQRRGAAQIHSPRNCLPAGGWEPVEASRVTIHVPRWGAITVNRYLIQKDHEIQVVLYWYEAQGIPVADELRAKFAMMRNAAFRNRTDGALVRVSAPVVHGAQEAVTDRLVRYVQALYPVLEEYLPE